MTRGNGRIFARKGSTSLWCAYYLRGREYRESTGTANEKKAEKFLKHRLKEVGADQLGIKTFVGPQQQRLTVSDLLDALQADYELRDKASAQFKSHLKHIREYFGNVRALTVSEEMVDSFIGERLNAQVAPATVNRSTQLLGQAFKLAIDRKRLSSAPKVRKLSERGNVRQGFFSDSEFRTVVANLPEYLRDFALFGYLTGWRRNEIASLRWEDLDGEVIRLRGDHAKNGKARNVPLEGDLTELIERRKDLRKVRSKKDFCGTHKKEIEGARERESVVQSSLIFHNEGRAIGDFRKAWSSACVMANVGKLVCPVCGEQGAARLCAKCHKATQYFGKLFHDLRRTAVRNMVRAGVAEHTAMQISGHVTRSMFDRYDIVSEADMRNALQKTQQHVKTVAATQRVAAVPISVAVQ